MRARVSENPTPIGLTLFVLHSDRFPFMFDIGKTSHKKTMSYEDTLSTRQTAHADLRL